MSKKDEAMKLALEEMKVGNYNSAAERLETALAEQPTPIQSWKLVPVEPTADMWKAVNKLDDEMAAGSYDGKGCSIEQAWDCLLAAAPQPQQEPVATKLESQQLHGFPVSAEDFKKLKALPVGTKLYTTPQEQSAQRARDDAESCWDDRYGTGGSYGIGGCYGPASFTDGDPNGY